MPLVIIQRVTTALAFTIVVLQAPLAVGQQPGAIPGRCADPPSTRTSEVGCYLLSNERLERLPDGPLFWHLHTYPSRAAADAVPPDVPTVVAEAFGKVWRFALAHERWKPSSGERVSAIGPLIVPPSSAYMARFMEATFPPNRGMLTTVHRHSGPEAWYVLTGAQCLRTSSSTMVLRAGEGGTVAAGPPMVLTSIGDEVRRSFVLVLHDASEPWQTNTSEWSPSTECRDR